MKVKVITGRRTGPKISKTIQDWCDKHSDIVEEYRTDICGRITLFWKR